MAYRHYEGENQIVYCDPKRDCQIRISDVYASEKIFVGGVFMTKKQVVYLANKMIDMAQGKGK